MSAPYVHTPLKIGQYKIGRTLGVGSFGKVKLGTHESSNLRVAIKILNRKKIKTLDMMDKIQREIQILTSFSHPHIIRLYEVIDTPTDIFMIMEYVPNGELFEYIVSHGRLQEDMARRFFHQVVFAIQYCHQHNVVHRDLKPENLLLDASNDIKLADFGLSNILFDGDFLKTSCGSPNYAAPEVISGNPYAGPEVDVWSCGILLYALLCGRLPFDDEVIPTLFKKIKSGIFHLPGYLSDQSRDLISRMLVVNPLDRYTVDDIRSHPWFTKNIPGYLPETLKDSHTRWELDEDLVEQLAKMYSSCPDFVSVAIQNKRNDERISHNITVAYQLLRDQKFKAVMEKAKRKNSDSNPASPMFVGDNSNSVFSALHVNSQIRIAPAEKPPLKPPTPGKISSTIIINDPAKKRGWYNGIRCNIHPSDIMLEIYRVLTVFHCEWKTVSPFEIRVRCLRTTASGTNILVRMAARLYRIGESKYLIDVQRLEGSYIPFMELCANVLTRLQHSLNSSMHSHLS